MAISATSATGYINPDTNAPVSPSNVFLVEGRGFPGPAAIGRNVVTTIAGSFLNYNLLNGGGRTMRLGLRRSF